jgi:hypothetical protein
LFSLDSYKCGVVNIGNVVLKFRLKVLSSVWKSSGDVTRWMMHWDVWWEREDVWMKVQWIFDNFEVLSKKSWWRCDEVIMDWCWNLYTQNIKNWWRCDSKY